MNRFIFLFGTNSLLEKELGIDEAIILKYFFYKGQNNQLWDIQNLLNLKIKIYFHL